MKYPLGIQTFSKIINEQAIYVDKTALLYDLVVQGAVYFLSRPRRFGKSILISTLESLFLGEKELFDGLAISQTNYDFIVHPVIKLEFSGDEFESAENLRSYIAGALDDIAKRYGIALTKPTYNQRFSELVSLLHLQTGQKVVLLIDEYDKPILNNLNKATLGEIKQVLNAFYSAAKSLDQHLRFVFITGVTKFAKVSVFSGMNNLTDISMDRRFDAICGITQNELESCFSAEIDELAEAEKMQRQAVLAKIKYWYNGYLFHPKGQGIYNPYSVLCLFSKQEFTNYWFVTATPTFLIELVKSQSFNLAQLRDFQVDELFFAATEPEQMAVEPVLLQTGYLTIVDFKDGWYRLDFPNYEVRYAFNRAIVQDFGGTSAGDLRYVLRLAKSLDVGDMSAFFTTLKIFFANIPYDISLNNEKYYQSLFYALFTLLGFHIEAEVRTGDGRIDCVLQTKRHIYIIEFKLNGSKEDALAQIIDKNYALKYRGSEKAITLLGVAFDPQTRNIGDYVVEED